jgi:fucose 4-O-acetylase-like acetyltransferase
VGELMLKSKREIWVDLTKIYACILVVLGHLFQSYKSSELIANLCFFDWFNQVIYYFHVPLFFICSGYLYQKYSKLTSFSQWRSFSAKKLVALGVPYFTFSFVTWFLKVVFPSAVNDSANVLLKTLFIAPLSPYWYLYALVVIFLIVCTIKKQGQAIGFVAAALLLKCVTIFVPIGAPILKSILSNVIWFVIGMLLCFWGDNLKIKKFNTYVLLLFAVVFLSFSIIIYYYNLRNDTVAFLMGLFACFITIAIALKFEEIDFLQSHVKRWAEYIFPVYLMHTIFAAALRSVLFKIGISDIYIHIILGIAISFAGPIIALKIMSKLKWMEFFLYPTKVLKRRW